MVFKSSISSAGGGGSGTVTQINTGTGLTGGPITTTGTISVASNTANTLAGYDNSGNFSDVTIGTNLTLSGGVLNATGGGGSGGLTWNDQTSSSVTMAVNNGYVTDNGASLVTYTMPVTASIGQIVAVVGKSAGKWLIAQNSGQTIHFGNTNTTTGTGGSLAPANQYGCVELICVTANTDWVVRSSVGNITVT